VDGLDVANKMHLFLRVMPRDAVPEGDPHLIEMLRACIEGAPGINNVDTIERHSRGGYAVSADREENLPREIDEYFEKSAFMIVI
jgi:hypothetical protein